MTRRLTVAALALTAIVLLMLELPLGINVARTEEYRLLVAMERDAGVIADLVEDRLENGPTQALEPPIGDYADRSGARVLVTDADGLVVHDSEGTALGRDYSSRPEIAQAILGRRSSGRRPSATLGQDLLYVAEPVTTSGRVLGAVRITYTAEGLAQRVRSSWITLGVSGAAVLVAAAVAATVLGRWASRPTRTLATTIAAMAEGDLGARAPDVGGPPELREVARRFNDLAARLVDLIDRQRRFAADASHQLRSPLTALRLELEDLEAELTAGGRSGPQVRQAIEEVDRLEAIVAGLLELARAESPVGPSDAGPARTDLADVAASRAAVAGQGAVKRGVAVEMIASDGTLPPVAAPEVHVVEVLDNLLTNAVRHAPAGTTVTVRVSRDGDHARCDVRDRGSGLDAVDRLRAFERFWRAHDSEPGTGSGLGLPIARGLARRYGGDVVLVDPDEGDDDRRGIVARLRLPVASAPVVLPAGPHDDAQLPDDGRAAS